MSRPVTASTSGPCSDRQATDGGDGFNHLSREADGMELIAHRGFAGVAPENTVGSVSRAAERADAVEVDLRRCGSGEVVVAHDETVDRVTDGTGPVADRTAAELAALDVQGSGEGIPTLSAVLAAVPDGTTMVLELKELGIAADALAAAARAATDVVVSSFRPAALAEAAAAEPGVPTALLFDRAPAPKLALADQLACAQVHPAVGLADRVVERAHAAGMAVHVWTVADRSTAERMADLGVDGVIADDPVVWPAGEPP